MDLYAIAISLAERFSALDTLLQLAQHSTFYLCRSLSLAAIVIIRLHKSSIQLPLDRGRGERCYFTTIQLLKQRSSDTEDLDSRLARILTELWTSPRVFRANDGTLNSLNIRVKSRLVSTVAKYATSTSRDMANSYIQTMCAFFDLLWWWRQEFRGEPDPFTSQGPVVSQDYSEDLQPSDDPFLVFPEFLPYDENYFSIYGDSRDSLNYT